MITVDTLQPDMNVQKQAEDWLRRGMISMTTSAASETLCCLVGASPTGQVTVNALGEIACDCNEEKPCAHMAAAARYLQTNGHLERYYHNRQLVLGEQMLTALNRAIPGTETVRLLPILKIYENGTTGFGLMCGQSTLYAVKSIADLLTCYTIGADLTMSKKFRYQPAYMRFSREDERLLSLLMDYIPLRAQTLEEWQSDIQAESKTVENGPTLRYDGRYLLLDGPVRHSVLRYLENRSFSLITGNEKNLQNGIETTDLPLCFCVSIGSGELQVTAKGGQDLRLVTPNARYVLWQNKIVHLHSAQARICRLMCLGGFSFSYPAEKSEELLSLLMPALATVGTVVPSQELSSRIVKEDLKPVIYLDVIDGYIEARVEYHYGDTVFHPFGALPMETAIATSVSDRLLLRDGRAESELMDFFSNAGFIVRGGRILLRRTSDILHFCTQGVIELGKLGEVYASTAFEKVKPRKLHARASFRSGNGRLIFELLEQNGNAVEVLPVLNALAQHQQYVRLKSGEFLDLRDMNGLSEVMHEVLLAASLDDPDAEADARELHFNAYRAAYMKGMLSMAGANTVSDAATDEASQALLQNTELKSNAIPKRLYDKLCNYQKRGAGWLCSLYDAHMGGILADEMGLGKTIQIIALLSAIKRRDGTQKSLIVTPTSLTYHWQAEIKRFDNSLVVRMLLGTREERHRLIHELASSNDVDVIITSYPLLRQDIDLLKEIPLRMTVLDEAQSVKNAQSLSANAVKEMQSQARFALTGTPMENGTGELWSIFDYILPGYLGTQSMFLRRYGNGENTEELRSKIRPFLMRRLKSDVMADLPQKREQYLYAAMTPEQKSIYDDLLAKLRLYVGQALSDGSLPRARLQVLSMLLKLRQVCCHPKLFLSDYAGQSGKLELLVQIVHTALDNGHRMLIFSQFVGMLQMIRSRLYSEGLSSLYLDGSTKPEERLNLCNSFNAGEGSIFLISLKAGGTGLNLVGADLVIHYDPWWNPAAEDQATDRAHRIGQTHEVDVIRLISQDSIEEKVTDMSQHKRALFEKVIQAGETNLASLTEEDIRMLFFT